jgi:hypothetical protein
LDHEKYPLFVSEGTSLSKWKRIMHNAYLHKAFRSFESCSNPGTNTLLVFGHSLAENDDHILKCISKGRMPIIAVGVYGKASDDEKANIQNRANIMIENRLRYQGERHPLNVIFFDTQTASVWG